MSERIYLDNAATTKVSKEVMEAMTPFFEELYGNPSSIYELARTTKKYVDEAREQVGKALGADPSEIYFTAGGTEADNWALRGIAEGYKDKGNHIITTAVEHHAVLHTCAYLEKNGFDVTYLPVDPDGRIDLDDLRRAINPQTILISIMFANNEIGTIQPIKEIGQMAKENGILFHTDAVQAVGHVDIDVKAFNIDLLSLSGHKLYGPKGIGALYIRKGIKIKPLIYGGAQERNRRAGTENVPGIVGLGKAVESITVAQKEENEKLIYLREKLINGILENVPYCRVNGSREYRLPGNVNISFEFIEGESLLLLLDMQGIAGSSGSACTSGSLDPSHVLLSIGLPHEKAHGSLRLTIGKYNTEAEIDKVIQVIPPLVHRLREMSPLYEEISKKQ